MSKEIAIQITDVTKCYRLGQINSGSLQTDLQTWWSKIRHKEDPNSKIGQANRLEEDNLLALRDINLTIYKGEAVGIIGRNGAGKSTLLKLLSRITAPTKGNIKLYGRVSSMLEVGTGFNGEMTGKENIYMNGAILGMSKKEIDRKLDRIIEFSECGDYIDTPVKRYSSGMYVKLAFSVAAHLDAEIMVLDEVLAVGDMKFQKKCLGTMGDASENDGKTILYVSHNMNTIRQFCKRCIVLDEGRIIFDGDVEEGIQVYMDTAADEMETNFDISNKRLKYLSPILKAKMMSVTIVEKSNSKFEIGEKMRFNLDIQAYEDIENASLRFEVRAADESSVGTAFAFSFGRLEKNKRHYLETSLPLCGLVPGKYSVVLGLFEKNEMGSYEDLDVVEKALGFEIADSKSQLGINWLGGFWGNVKFEDIKVERISVNDAGGNT